MGPVERVRHAQDAANNALLLKNMADTTNRSARFVCAIALARKGQVLSVVRGFVEGQLLQSASGTNGFGYDPLFVPAGCTKSFAEPGEDAKNELSHRALALKKLKEFMAKGTVDRS